MRSTLAFATSTSARATSDFGRVPTSKKPRAERRFSSARSTACWFTWIRRTAKLMLVNDSFTVCVTSWRCSSVSSRAKSASLRAASVDAKFFPKSNRICESDRRATVVVVHVVIVRAVWVAVVAGTLPPLPADVLEWADVEVTRQRMQRREKFRNYNRERFRHVKRFIDRQG